MRKISSIFQKIDLNCIMVIGQQLILNIKFALNMKKSLPNYFFIFLEIDVGHMDC
jgi:hypothetical protein